MSKKTKYIVETVLIVFMIVNVLGFYEDTNSISRFSPKSNLIRIGLDILLASFGVIRLLQMTNNFQKEYSNLGNLKTWNWVIYIGFIISILPDISNWFKWYFHADLYLHLLIVYCLQLSLWTLEVVERESTKKNKHRNYMIVIISLLFSTICYTIVF